MNVKQIDTLKGEARAITLYYLRRYYGSPKRWRYLLDDCIQQTLVEAYDEFSQANMDPDGSDAARKIMARAAARSLSRVIRPELASRSGEQARALDFRHEHPQAKVDATGEASYDFLSEVWGQYGAESPSVEDEVFAEPDDGDPAEVGGILGVELTGRQRQVAEALRDYPQASYSEIADMIGLDVKYPIQAVGTAVQQIRRKLGVGPYETSRFGKGYVRGEG